MHKIDIVIGHELQYTEFAENFGKARKRKNQIMKQGFELVENKSEVATHYPPHRIVRIDIYPVKEPEEKQQEEQDD